MKLKKSTRFTSSVLRTSKEIDVKYPWKRGK